MTPVSSSTRLLQQASFVMTEPTFRSYLILVTGWVFAYRTQPELAVTLLHVLYSDHQQRRFHAIADSAYGGKSVYLNLPDHCDLTSRLDLDARLYQAAPPSEPGANDRPRRRSSRLPAPKEMLQTRSRRITLDIYGQRDRSRVAQQAAYLYAMPDRPIRMVAVEPLTGGRRTQAFYSTQSAAPAEQVLTRHAMRWSIEEAFQNSKGHLGFEEPPGWTRRAVERTAPTATLLYALIVLWFASEGHRHYQPPHRPWYLSKTQASFADMLATVQKLSVEEEVSSLRLSSRDKQNVANTITRAFLGAA